MSNTKQIVQSAMFVALIGALLIINREMAFIFDYFVNILVSVIIITYVAKYDFRSGCFMSIGILVVTFLFGSFYSYLYMPLSIIAGLTYAYFIYKDKGYAQAIIWTLVVYVLGETLLMNVIIPLLGQGDFEEFFTTIKAAFDTMGIAIDKDVLFKVAKMIYVVSAAITGFFEAILIHMLTIIVFKKFKIKKMVPMDLSKMILPTKVAYLCFIACFGFILGNYFIENDPIYYTIMIGAVLGATILVLQGAVYLLTYGAYVRGHNYGFLIILFTVFLFPYSLIILLVLGFMYASGPLLHHMNRKRGL